MTRPPIYGYAIFQCLDGCPIGAVTHRLGRYRMGYRGVRIGAAYTRGINGRGKEKGRRAVTRRPRYCEKVDMNISRKPASHISVPVGISVDARLTDLQVRVYLRLLHHATTAAPDPELLADLIDSELGCGRHVALSAICALVTTGWIGGDR